MCSVCVVCVCVCVCCRECQLAYICFSTFPMFIVNLVCVLKTELDGTCFLYVHRMLACDHENVRPDLLVLGKALSGGVLPVRLFVCLSCCLMIMECFQYISLSVHLSVLSACFAI